MSNQRQDIINHLQAAAKELIAAGRAALDLADEMVSDGIRVVDAYARGAKKPPDAPKVRKIPVEDDRPPGSNGR